MIPTCPFCGAFTEQASDASDHWLECTAHDCRAQGPHRQTPEGASLAFLNRASRLRPASIEPPRHCLASHGHE